MECSELLLIIDYFVSALFMDEIRPENDYL